MKLFERLDRVEKSKKSPSENQWDEDRRGSVKAHSGAFRNVLSNRHAPQLLLILALFGAVLSAHARHTIMKRNYSDQSVRGYLAERTCWWNEVCKEEFHSKFRCRCPRWSYCRAPGRYYDAHCSMTRTGYIWTQPETSVALEIDK